MFDDDEQEAPFLEDSLKKAGVPLLTRWRHIVCGGFWAPDKYYNVFYKHLECQFFPFTFFQCLFLSSYFIWKFQIYDMLHESYGFLFFFVTFCYIMSVIALYKVVFSNPGYLPFYYPATDRKTFTDEEYQYGKALFAPQIKWARKQKRPNRSIFSAKVGYFVLRADHYCAWMTNWIGLKNQRYFIIFLFYGSIVLISIFLNTLSFMHYHYSLHSTAFYIFALSASGFFSIFIGLQLLQQVYNATFNTLTMELIKQMEPFYSRGTLNNWEEVCGSSKYICLWPFPCYNHKPIIDGFDFPDYPYPIKDMPKRFLLEEEDEKDTNSNVDTNISQEDLSNNDKFEIDTNIL